MNPNDMTSGVEECVSPEKASSSSSGRGKAQAAGVQNWMSSPFSQLEVLSPGSNMESFCLSSPYRLSPGQTFANIHEGDRSGSVDMGTTPSKGGDAENLSTLFSPSLFSPYSQKVTRKRRGSMSKENGGSNKQTHNHAGEVHGFSEALLDAENGDSNDVDDSGDYASGSYVGMSLLHQNNSEDKGPSSFRPSMSMSSTRGHGMQGMHMDNSLTESLMNSKALLSQARMMAAARHGVDGTRCTPSRAALFSSPDGTHPMPAKMSPPLVVEDVRNQCNCKKSKCLKLYCECFAALKFCQGCNCLDCYNNADCEQMRQEAIQSTKERNPSAFKTKVMKMNEGEERHSTGCNCKKSQCLKKYCECFEGGVICGEQCKCKSCQNYEGSDALDSARASKDKKMSSAQRAMSYNRGGRDSASNSPPSSQSHGSMTMTMTMQQVATGHAIMAAQAAQARRVKFARMNMKDPPVYDFFGTSAAPMRKVDALRVLDFLDNTDIYNMSQVSRLWSHVAVDEAIWDYSGWAGAPK